MNTDKIKNNETQERRVVSYLPPRYHRLFIGYQAYQEMSESATCADILKKFFDSMPEKERQRIMAHSKNSY